METCYDKLEPSIYAKIAQTICHAGPILDVGCGDGRLVNFLASKLRKKIVGVDISDIGFKKAREEAELKNVSRMVKYMKTSGSNLNIFKDDFLVELSASTLYMNLRLL